MTLVINTKTHECPHCHSRNLQRIPRGFVIRVLMPWLPIKRYRCWQCERKTYLFKK